MWASHLRPLFLVAICALAATALPVTDLNSTRSVYWCIMGAGASTHRNPPLFSRSNSNLVRKNTNREVKNTRLHSSYDLKAAQGSRKKDDIRNSSKIIIEKQSLKTAAQTPGNASSLTQALALFDDDDDDRVVPSCEPSSSSNNTVNGVNSTFGQLATLGKTAALYDKDEMRGRSKADLFYENLSQQCPQSPPKSYLRSGNNSSSNLPLSKSIDITSSNRLSGSTNNSMNDVNAYSASALLSMVDDGDGNSDSDVIMQRGGAGVSPPAATDLKPKFAVTVPLLNFQDLKGIVTIFSSHHTVLQLPLHAYHLCGVKPEKQWGIAGIQTKELTLCFAIITLPVIRSLVPYFI